MKKLPLDLGIISENKAVKFDFRTQTTYIENFEIVGTQKKGDKYSKANTFWLTMVLISVISLVGFILDRLFIIPPVIGFICASIIGIAPVKIALKRISKRSFVKSYDEVSKEDVVNVLKSGTRHFWGLLVTNWIISMCLVLLFIIAVSESKMQGKFFITIILGMVFVTFIETTVRPKQSIKARKILRKQLKEGKFDD